MSKEQTPIELIIELIMTDPTATLDAKALCDNVLRSYLVVEKEHINSKVLEALEEVKTHIEKQPKLYPLSLWAKLSIMKYEATKQK